jgi:hypothetical protein
MYHNSNSDSQLNKVMSNEQFNQVVDAILSGKYSWACLLILRFSGYNPLHYIPYRTYNRLMKIHREQRIQPLNSLTKANSNSAQETRLNQQSSRKLRDLYHLEEIDAQSVKVKGGSRKFSLGIFSRWFAS